MALKECGAESRETALRVFWVMGESLGVRRGLAEVLADFRRRLRFLAERRFRRSRRTS